MQNGQRSLLRQLILGKNAISFYEKQPFCKKYFVLGIAYMGFFT